LQADHAAANEKAMDAAKSIGVTPPDAPKREAKGRLRKDIQEIAGGKLAH
jgi:putative membrane protein